MAKVSPEMISKAGLESLEKYSASSTKAPTPLSYILVYEGIRRLLRRRGRSKGNARQKSPRLQTGSGAIREEAKQVQIKKPQQEEKSFPRTKVRLW